MSEMKANDVRAIVREHYRNIARGVSAGCAPGCCRVIEPFVASATIEARKPAGDVGATSCCGLECCDVG
jgi:hypothetical protein